MTKVANPTAAPPCHYRILELESLHEVVQQLLQVHSAFWFSSYPSPKKNFQHIQTANEMSSPERNVRKPCIRFWQWSYNNFVSGPVKQHYHVIAYVKDRPPARQSTYLVILRWDINYIYPHSGLFPYSKL